VLDVKTCGRKYRVDLRKVKDGVSKLCEMKGSRAASYLAEGSNVVQCLHETIGELRANIVRVVYREVKKLERTAGRGLQSRLNRGCLYWNRDWHAG
jgi:hypothetical protein